MQDKSIKVIDANKYFGKTRALCDVNMECNKGEIVGIIGRNGAGKTVLFKVILKKLFRNAESGIFVHDKQ